MECKNEYYRELFLEISNDNQQSFRELFNAFYEKLIRFSMQFTRREAASEDIVTDALVKLWEHRKSIRDIQKPAVYLYVLVKNASINYQKKFSTSMTILVDGQNSVQEASLFVNTPETILEEKELLHKLNMAIESLPSQSRLIFKMIKHDGLRSKQVAEILHISTRTVENQLYRSIKKLANIIQPYCSEQMQRKYFSNGAKTFYNFLLSCSL